MVVLDYKKIKVPEPKLKLSRAEVKELGLVGDEVILFRTIDGKIEMTIHYT